VAASLTPRAGPIQARLREREPELAELAVAIQDAREGNGRFVLLEGAAGAGKSALVAAALHRARASGLRPLVARGGELEQEFAFGVIRQLFESLVSAADAPTRRRLFDGAAAPARWVLSPESDDGADRSGGGFAAMRAIFWLACNVAVSGPLLLVVDDAHWVDASSLRALSFVARRLADVPIALLVAAREDEPGAPAELLDELRVDPSALRLTVRPLSAVSSASVVRELLPEASDEICSAVYNATAGNPLYVRELLRSVDGDGSIAAVHEASLPTLGERTARRVARVAPGAAALTTAMAVLGDGGRLPAAARLAGLDESEAASIAARLERLEVLSCADPFEFVHPLVRRSVYERQSVTERDTAHAAAATLLQGAGASAETVAAHLALVRPSGSTATAGMLVEAAQHALARAAPDEALAWLRRAVAEEASAPPRAELLAQLGHVGVAVRDPASIKHLQESLAEATDPSLRARVAAALAEILMNVGQWDAGRQLLDAAREEHRDGDPALQLELTAVHAVSAAYDADQAQALAADRARLAELCAADGWAAHALAAVLAAVAAMRGEGAERVLSFVDRALEGGRLLSERAAGAWASAQVIGALVAIDADERALEVCDEVAVQARACGSLIGLMTAFGYRGCVAVRRGELVSGEAELRTALAMFVEAEMPMVFLSAAWFLADAILERPSLGDVAALVEATELEPIFLNTWSGGMLLQVRGRLRLARHDDQGAIGDLRASARIAAAMGMGPAMSAWRSTLALALPAEQRDEAVELVAEELRLARSSGVQRAVAVALRADGQLSSGSAAIERLRASVGLLQDSSARLEHARSQIELGAALRRHHLRTEAREHLRAGIDGARRCGAQRLAVRGQDELRAAGGKPRTYAIDGVAGLTASELRVARLAADGRTNPQIAQDLFVSLKTVETHLSHAYGKLGLSGQGSRGRLVGTLNGHRRSDDGFDAA
jgi:DNA-binding CsgD family transcriptional regulator